MKKVVLLVISLIVAALASNNSMAQTRISQEHLVSIGIHYGYGASPIANLGGANLDFNMASSNLRIRVNADALQVKRPKDDDNICIGFSANAQYLFAVVNKETCAFYLYPMAGVGVNFNKASGWKGDYGIGFNFGAGAEFQINDRFGVYVEGGYEVRFNSEHKPAFRVGFSYAI